MDDAGSQQQTEGLRHQHQFDRQVCAFGDRCRMPELDAAFGNDHRLRFADLPKHSDCDHLAE
ncbi:hypothetical protein D3C85_1643810 [compost metagenome]